MNSVLERVMMCRWFGIEFRCAGRPIFDEDGGLGSCAQTGPSNLQVRWLAISLPAYWQDATGFEPQVQSN